MNHFKKYLSLLLALTLMLSAFSGCGKKAAPAAAEAAPAETAAATEAPAVAETEAPAQETVSDGYYHVGDKIDDFTVTTYDGKEISLYKVLEEKEMVLLNFWATWCGPCGAEFPAIQEAYEQYQDKVEIIALSTAETDTDADLAEYVQNKGMTFPVCKDTLNLYGRIHAKTIPTSVVVDRFGVICTISSGSATEPAVFTDLFDIFTGEDYTESAFMPNIHAKVAGAKPVDPALLNEALNVEGGNLVFTNPTDRFTWPMTVEEKDGRTVVSATNADVTKSVAKVETQVEAKAGDVLVMDYMLGNNANLSVMRITVDGQDAKVTSLSQGWTTITYAFAESGTHQVAVTFERSIVENDGREGLWIDSIRLATGDEAAEILANKPKYPVSDYLDITLLNENKEAVMLNTDGDLIECWICDDPVLRVKLEIPAIMDPETTFVEDFAENPYPLTSYIAEDGYVIEIPNEDPASHPHSIVTLFWNGMPVTGGFFFPSMEKLEAYAQGIAEESGRSVKVVSAEDDAVLPEEPAGDGTYTVTYVDQNGDPVPGVMCQVCDKNTCQVFVSDANGVCEFQLPFGTYEIHTLKVPAGYEGDTTTITEAPMGGGELSFTLTKK